MSGRCPYIGLEGNQTQVYLTDHPRHRCYVTGVPQPVPGAHQGTICLTSAYRRCPHLRAAGVRQDAPSQQRREEAQDLASVYTGAAGGHEVLSPDATAAGRPRYADLRPVPRRLWDSGWWRWLTRTEGVVLSLMVCIVCASVFVGYGLLRRVQVGPGMPGPAVTYVAGRPASSTPAPMVTASPTFMSALDATVAPPPGPPPTSATVMPSSPAPATPSSPAPATPSSSGPAAPAAPLTPTVTPTSAPALEPTLANPPGPTPTSAEATVPPPTPGQQPGPEPTMTSETPGRPSPATSSPTRLVLPGIRLNVPVRPVKVKEVGQGADAKKVWEELPNVAGFHDTSAYPGHAGNTVINGHRDVHGAVFRHLDQVQVGDEILLYVGPVAYAYRVGEILIVPETNATLAQQAENQRLIGYMPEERLTLITRTPVGSATHWLLVIGRPSE